MDQALIDKAKKANLAHYLLSKGENLKQVGNRYRHKDHNSLVFTNNFYSWNSKNDKGDSIKYLTTYCGMDFKTAVMELSGAKVIDTSLVYEIDFNINNINISKDMRRAIAYLNKTRGIDYKLIVELINKKLLFQEESTNNIIFPMLDENRKIVGAEIAGTLTDKRFKGIKSGSKYGYGYNIRYGNEIRYILYFESAIDLISLIEIQRIKGKNLEGCLLVSLSGLKENVFYNMLDVFKNDLKPIETFLCIDNDIAGLNFLKCLKVAKNDFKIYFPSEGFKDWNEQLKSIKKIC